MKKTEALQEISSYFEKATDKIRQAHETDDIHIAQAVMISPDGHPAGQIATLITGKPAHLAFGISDIITDIIKNMNGEEQERFIASVMEGVKARGTKVEIELPAQGLNKCPNTILH